MFSRGAKPVLTQALGEFPAVAILGPRQVGKTTLVLDLIREHPDAVYLDLESPEDRAKLAEPSLYLRAHRGRLVVVDEVQRMPELFPVLRGEIDQRRRAAQRTGQFLLLGSATGARLARSAESLAGRIAYVELPGLIVPEVPADRAERLWLRGGFPDAFTARDEGASRRWREQFISTYLERDIPLLGPRIPAATLRRLWTMLAHEQGQLLNAARLASALGLSGQTVARYIDLLCDLMLVRRLAPWAGNEGKRMVRSPKVFVRDSGLTHTLLGLESLDDVLGHPVAGASWEGFVIEHLLAAAPVGTRAHFYRTAAGAEVDLVLERAGGERWAIEVKRSSAPAVGRGFHSAADDLRAAARWVVHAGRDSFDLAHDVRAITLPAMVDALRSW
jgi:predicted AAA+ superfamily ATPase